jgi:hypothetical protein
VAKSETFRMLFRRPVREDWAFQLWLGLAVLSGLASLWVNYSSKSLTLSGPLNVISGLLDAVFGFLSWYLISLIWLVPRRILARRNQRAETAVNGDLIESQDGQLVDDPVSRPSWMRIAKWGLVGLGVVVALFAVDQGVRNLEMRALLAKVEKSEAISLDFQSQQEQIDFSYYSRDTEEKLANLAYQYSPRAASSGAEVGRVFIFPWHTSLKHARSDYLDHNQAWLQSYKSKVILDDNQWYSSAAVQEVSNSWAIFKDSIRASLPLVDTANSTLRVAKITSN